jgi:carbon monoxide dehydrogenase subunit G
MGQCYNSTIIAAPKEKVWATIKDFHDMSWGKPVITHVEKIGAINGHQAGAKRILNQVFQETLKSVDEENCTFTYSIDDGPGPVAKDSVQNYQGTVTLRPITDTNHTFIEWRSSFESNSRNEVSEFCNPIYAGLLKALKDEFK